MDASPQSGPGGGLTAAPRPATATTFAYTWWTSVSPPPDERARWEAQGIAQSSAGVWLIPGEDCPGGSFATDDNRLEKSWRLLEQPAGSHRLEVMMGEVHRLQHIPLYSGYGVVQLAGRAAPAVTRSQETIGALYCKDMHSIVWMFAGTGMLLATR